MRLKKTVYWALAGLVPILAIMLSPLSAYAYSGIGIGTSSSPYRISTCSQLGEMANNLAGYYVLNNNINCNGSTFTSVGTTGNPFTGTLDGQGHTINGLNFNTCGIFCANTNSTVENLNVINGTADITAGGSSYAQGIISGQVDSSTFSNLHSNDSLILGSGAGVLYAGGLVGLTYIGTSNISNSSFTGSIVSNGCDYVGGLIGTTYESVGTGNLTNDYSNASITLGASTTGEMAAGLNGFQGSGTTTDSYAAGTLTNLAGSSTNLIAGFAGELLSGASVTNSFSATKLVGGAQYVEGAFVDQSASAPNLYFDQYLAGTSDCSNDSPTYTCTAENSSNNAPSYFYSAANTPLSSWDFNNIWEATSTYPTLRSLNAINVPTPPNGGDLQNNGQQDEYEYNVTDIEDTNSTWASVSIPSSDGCVIGNGASVSSTSLNSDKGYSLLTNPLDFNIYCPTVGESVPITIVYDREYSSPVLQFYNSTTGTYTNVPNAVFSVETIGGVPRTVVTYTATDGGQYDEDSTANGIIEDPVSLGQVAASAPDTGFGAPSSYTYRTILTYSFATIGFIALAIGLRISRKAVD